MPYLCHRARQFGSAPTRVAGKGDLEKFVCSLQVCLESDVVNQSLVIVEQRFLFGGFRFLALAWRLGGLTRGLGQLYALIARVSE